VKNQTYIYNVNYSEYEETLCAIENRALFNTQLKEKIFFSDVKVNPSVSAFIKNRFKIIYKTSTFEDLLSYIEQDENLETDFIVKYMKMVSGDPYAASRNSLCKKIASQFKQSPNYESPKITYGVTFYQDEWYFGVLVKNNSQWREHNNRPYTYSNSLKINMAKVLINVAGRGDLSTTIIDPCCGAGTVLLEGCFAGYTITGSDISWKTAKNAAANLEHFGYKAQVNHQAIQDISEHYDCSIIDLPYGLYSQTTPEDQSMIIRNAKRISDRVVVISSEDITDLLANEHLEIVDSCKFIKSTNRKFARYIWVCEHSSEKG